MNRPILLAKLSVYLAQIITYVKLQNRANLYDINILCQDILIPLLNKLFKADLQNLDFDNTNNEAIDLSDKNARVSFQITSDKTTEKVKETLTKFITGRNENYKKYDKLYHFIISDKQISGYNQKIIDNHIDELFNRQDCEKPIGFSFSTNNNIIDLNDFVRLANFQLSRGLISLEDLNDIVVYLESEAGNVQISESSINHRQLKLDIDFLLNENDLSREELVEILAVFKDGIIGDDVKKTLNRLENLLTKYSETIDDLRSHILNLGISDGLILEWNTQLFEIQNDLDDFAPNTALKRIRNLSARIKNSGFKDNILLGKLYYIEGLALAEINFISGNNESADFFLKAYEHDSTNLLYKMYVAYSGLFIDKTTQSLKLADEILEVDKFNHIAWLVQLHTTDISFIKDFLLQVPKETRENRNFVINSINWLIVNKLITHPSDLNDFGLKEIHIDENEPLKLTFKNKSFWTTISHYLVNSFFFGHNEINLYLVEPIGVNNFKLNQAARILKIVIDATTGTEIEGHYYYLKFFFHYINLLRENDLREIDEMEVVFPKIKNKEENVVLYMCQSICHKYQNNKGIKKSIEIIKEWGFDKSDNACFLACMYCIQIKDYTQAKNIFYKYLSLLETGVINENKAYCIVQFLSVYLENANNEIDLDIFGELTFESNDLKILTQYVISSFVSNSINTELENTSILSTNIKSFNPRLIDYFAESLIKSKQYNLVIKLYETVDKTVPSKELKWYCKAIYYSLQQNRTQLLEILKNWRTNYTPDYELLRIELHLRSLLKDWDSIESLSKKGIEEFNNDEAFFYSYILALHSNEKHEIIQEYAEKILNFGFLNEENALGASVILRCARKYEESIELLYRTATIENNKLARRNYITATINYPKKLLIDYKEVKVGRYVKFKIDNDTKIISITDDNKDSTLVKSLIGKKIGDILVVEGSLGNIFKTGTVERVMNKYLGLSVTLLKEAEENTFDYKMETIKTPSNKNGEFKKQMIERFGAEGTVRKDITNQRVKEYEEGRGSFTELTRTVFGGRFLDSYYTLTSLKGHIFKSFSTAFFTQRLDDYSDFMLDVTSLGVFFEISKELEIEPKHKFVISPHIKQEIKDELYEIEHSEAPKLAVEITLSGIRTHTYHKDFRKNRTKFLKDILVWIDKRCICKSPNRKVDFALEIDFEASNDCQFQTNIDCRLFMESEGSLLISDDMVYNKYFGTNMSLLISPEYYLSYYFPEKSHDISSFLLQRQYVGIQLNRDMLKSEFIKQMTGKENKFPLILQNLMFIWNPNEKHIIEVVKFLKWLMLHEVFLIDVKERTSMNVLSYFLVGMKLNDRKKLKNMILKEFKLTGSYLDLILEILSITLPARKVVNN